MKRPKVKTRRQIKRRLKWRPTLEYQLIEALMSSCGERGRSEGAVDTLYRIKHERDDAFLILALDRLKSFREGKLR